jgi:hypothetical protein
MPLGSSKFTFRKKLYGSGTSVDPYPSWPTLPNANVFYNFVSSFDSTGTPTVASANYTALPNELNSSVFKTLDSTLISLPDGNVMLSGTFDNGNFADKQQFDNHVFVYSPTSSNIANINATSNLGTDPDLNDQQTIVLNPNTRTTFGASRTNTFFTKVAEVPQYVSDSAGSGLSLGEPNLKYLQSVDKMILTTHGGGNGEAYLVENTGSVSAQIALDAGIGDFDFDSSCIAEHPRTANVYYTHNEIDQMQEYDPSTDTVRQFVPPDTANIFDSGLSNNAPVFGTAVLGCDENIYFLPGMAGNVLIYNPVNNTSVVISESPGQPGASETQGNSTLCGVLAPDGNIYAPQIGRTNPSVECKFLCIDTKPNSATYKQITYYDIPDYSENPYSMLSCAIASDNKILTWGTHFTTPTNPQKMHTLQVSGTGFYTVQLNPYLNGE